MTQARNMSLLEGTVTAFVTDTKEAGALHASWSQREGGAAVRKGAAIVARHGGVTYCTLASFYVRG